MLEIAVVQTKATRELPDSFDGIQFGTVSGEKVQFKAAFVLVPPGFVDSRMMIGSIVGNNHHPASAYATGLAQLPQEFEASLPIESLAFPAKYKAAVAQTYRAEIAHALAGRGVQENRILDFWRYPHAAA